MIRSVRRARCLCLTAWLAACSSAQPGPAPAEPGGQPGSPAPVIRSLDKDGPIQTGSASFTAPARWQITERPGVVLLEAPEGDLRAAVVQVEAADGDAAAARAWQAAGMPMKRAVRLDHMFCGMGLVVDSEWGVPVILHGGGMIGFRSQMFFLPDHGVGGVILANADSGGVLLRPSSGG